MVVPCVATVLVTKVSQSTSLGLSLPVPSELLEGRDLLGPSPSPGQPEGPWTRIRAHELFEGRLQTSPSYAPAASPGSPDTRAPGAHQRDSTGPSDGLSVVVLTRPNVELMPPPGGAHTFQEAQVVQGPSTCCSLSREEELSQVWGFPKVGPR